MKKLWLVLSGVLLLQVMSASLVRAGEFTPTERMRREMGMILEDSRFSYTDYWSGLQKFFTRLNSFFKKKQSAPPLPRTSDHPLLRGLGAGFFVGIGLLLVMYLTKVFRRERSFGVQRVDSERQETAPPTLRNLARGYAAGANYREAIRYLYREALHQLAVRGWIPAGVALSDGEYLRLLYRRLGEEHPGYLAFRRLVRRFQAGWYGCKDCDALDYQEAATDLETVMRGSEING